MDALGCATLVTKTSLGALGPNKEEKQVMLQLAVTIRSCRGSLCCGTVHGQVALTCSKSVCRTLGTKDSHSQCGKTLVCVVHVLAFCVSRLPLALPF